MTELKKMINKKRLSKVLKDVFNLVDIFQLKQYSPDVTGNKCIVIGEPNNRYLFFRDH